MELGEVFDIKTKPWKEINLIYVAFIWTEKIALKAFRHVENVFIQGLLSLSRLANWLYNKNKPWMNKFSTCRQALIVLFFNNKWFRLTLNCTLFVFVTVFVSILFCYKWFRSFRHAGLWPRIQSPGVGGVAGGDTTTSGGQHGATGAPGAPGEGDLHRQGGQDWCRLPHTQICACVVDITTGIVLKRVCFVIVESRHT